MLTNSIWITIRRIWHNVNPFIFREIMENSFLSETVYKNYNPQKGE